MSQTHPHPDGDFELDEDLFDFASVAHASEAGETEEDLDEVFASFRDAAASEELLPASPASTPPRAAQPPVEAPAPHAEPGPALPRTKAPSPAQEVGRAEEAQVAALLAEERVRALAPGAPPSRFSKSLVAIALAVTAINSVVAVTLLWRPSGASSDVRGEPSGESGAEPASAAHAAPPHDSAPVLPDPEQFEAIHAHPVLDEARTQISHGEYAAARQRVYGLLAIIDRLEDPRRGALEADCQFLIAQSLHLEALARMGGSR